MFRFLKEKLKKAVSKFSKKVEEEAELEIKEEEKLVEVKEELKEEKVIPSELVKERGEEEKKEEKKKEKKKKSEEEKVKKEEKREGEEEEEKKKEPTEKEFEKGEEVKEIEEELETELGVKKEEELREEKLLEERVPEEALEKEKAKKSFFKKIFGRKEKVKEKKEEEVKPEIKKEVKPEAEKQTKKEPLVLATPEEEKEEEKKGLFKKIKERFTTIKLSEEKFEKLFWDLEVALLENNVAVEVIEKIKADLKTDLTTGKISRKGVRELIEESLRRSIEELFIDQHFNLVEEIKKKKEKPYIIAFIGVNGSGKTTTMAKIAHMLIQHRLSVVFAASDTFRAAAIQQLEEHAKKLGVKMIKHEYESDPAAVAYDAVQHARARNIDVVLIDTAGRLHSNDNLMNELKKLVRVNKPDLKIFVGESITGNDCIEQAKLFNQAVGIDVIILAKADVDEKGGAAVSISYVTKKPIIYLGTGQKYEDLAEFKPELVMKSIGL